MEDGTLAIMVPLMVRALRERSTVVNRRASVIIENMCKLVGAECLICCTCCFQLDNEPEACVDHREHVQASGW